MLLPRPSSFPIMLGAGFQHMISTRDYNSHLEVPITLDELNASSTTSVKRLVNHISILIGPQIFRTRKSQLYKNNPRRMLQIRRPRRPQNSRDLSSKGPEQHDIEDRGQRNCDLFRYPMIEMVTDPDFWMIDQVVSGL